MKRVVLVSLVLFVVSAFWRTPLVSAYGTSCSSLNINITSTNFPQPVMYKHDYGQINISFGGNGVKPGDKYQLFGYLYTNMLVERFDSIFESNEEAAVVNQLDKSGTFSFTLGGRTISQLSGGGTPPFNTQKMYLVQLKRSDGFQCTVLETDFAANIESNYQCGSMSLIQEDLVSKKDFTNCFVKGPVKWIADGIKDLSTGKLVDGQFIFATTSEQQPVTVNINAGHAVGSANISEAVGKTFQIVISKQASDQKPICNFETTVQDNCTNDVASSKTPPPLPITLCDQIDKKNPAYASCCSCTMGNSTCTAPSTTDSSSTVNQHMWTAVGCIPTSFQGLTSTIIKIGLSVAGGVALLMILAAAFMLTTSQGEPKAANEAKELLTSAVVGLLFIIFSITILQFIGVKILQLPGFGS